MFVSNVRNVCFSENLASFVFLLPPSWDTPFCLFTAKLMFSVLDLCLYSHDIWFYRDEIWTFLHFVKLIIIFTWIMQETCLRLFQIFIMEFLCENSRQLFSISYYVSDTVLETEAKSLRNRSLAMLVSLQQFFT